VANANEVAKQGRAPESWWGSGRLCHSMASCSCIWVDALLERSLRMVGSTKPGMRVARASRVVGLLHISLPLLYSLGSLLLNTVVHHFLQFAKLNCQL